MSGLELGRLRVVLGAHNLHQQEVTTQEFTTVTVVRHRAYDSAKLVIIITIIIIIIIIIILLKQDCKVQLANNKIQMAWSTSWLVVG